MNKHTKYAQAAFEYLATYGWILIILFFVMVYMSASGIFTESRITSEECSSQINLPCKAYSTKNQNQDSYNIGLVISNGMGYPINISTLTLQNIYEQGRVSHRKTTSVILNQGERYFFAFNGVNLPRTDIQKLKVQIVFSPCKDKGCGEDLYISDIKIITKPVQGVGFTEGYVNRVPNPASEISIPTIPGEPGFTSCDVCEQEGKKRCNFKEHEDGVSQICSRDNNGRLCWKDQVSCPSEARCDASTGECTSSNIPDRPDGEQPTPQTCSDEGKKRCNQNEELEECKQVNGQLVWQKDTSCTTQCQNPVGVDASCALCKKGSTTCFQNELFKYGKCEKDSSGLYQWNYYDCPSNQKCLPNSNSCQEDNRPYCEPIGSVVCGPTDNPKGLYRCTLNGWEKFYECPEDCYNGKCDREVGEYDTCRNGEQRCSADYLSLEECRGGVWVKIQNCNRNTYCSQTGEDEAECISR